MKAQKGYLVTVAQVNDMVPNGVFSKEQYATALLRFVSYRHLITAMLADQV